MIILQIFPSENTVQKVTRYFIDIGQTGLWSYFTLQAVLFYSLLFLTLFVISADLKRNTTEKPSVVIKLFSSNSIFIIFLIGFVLLSRIPLAASGQQNPDEASWVAIARTLLDDPRFWLSVDTGTGGPIVPLSLTTLDLFNLPIDIGSIKHVGGFILCLSLVALLFFFSYILDRGLARLVLLPLVVALSMPSHWDFIAFNSEHLVILFISLALVFFARLYKGGPGKYSTNLVLLGIFLGLMPLTKLQGAPVSFFIGLASLYILYTQSLVRKIPLLISFAMLPTLITLLFVWSYGALNYLWLGYIESNLVYASKNPIAENIFSAKMNLLFSLINSIPDLKYFFDYSFIVLLFGTILLLCNPKKIKREIFERVTFGLILFVISAYCIVAPHNYFPHYALIILVPITVMVGFVLQAIIKLGSTFFDQNESLKRLFAVLISMLLIGFSSFYYFQHKFTFRPPFLNDSFYDGYVNHGNLVAVMKSYYSPNAKLSIWGWTCSLYDDTNFLMGSRYSASAAQIDPGPMQDFYTQCFLEDIKTNKPLLFVETIASNFFRYKDRSKDGYQNYSRIRNHIDSNYNYAGEIEGARIFVRIGTPNHPWVVKSIKSELDTNYQFHGYIDNMVKDGSFINYAGWTTLGGDLTQQKVQLILISKSDTLQISGYQKRRVDIAVTFDNPDWSLSGFMGYIPMDELTEDEYQMGLYVVNGELKSFKDLNMKLKKSDFTDD